MGNIQFLNGGSNSCSSQTSNCDPVIGGLQVVPSNGASTDTTLGLPVYNNADSEGFIMAAHGVDSSNCGTTGTTINQGGTAVGTVSSNPPSSGSRESDSAFVLLNNSTQQFSAYEIYAGSDSYWYASSMVPSSQQSYQTQVAMQGLTSGYQTGYIASSGTVSISGDICNSSGMNFMIANITPHGGDSGAPVFTPADSNGNVAFYGIAVAKYVSGSNTYLAYSPWDFIQNDLDVH